jgi:hypothetical protein
MADTAAVKALVQRTVTRAHNGNGIAGPDSTSASFRASSNPSTAPFHAPAPAAAGAGSYSPPPALLPASVAALVAFAKAHRAAWLAWLPRAPGRALLDPSCDKLFADPKPYPRATLDAFWRDQQATGQPAAARQTKRPRPHDGGDDETRAEAENEPPAAAAAAAAPEQELPALACQHLVLLCVHAHFRFAGAASMDKVRRSFGWPPTTLVAMPCCHQFHPSQDLGRAPDLEYDDAAVFSAKRKVLVWKWRQGP